MPTLSISLYIIIFLPQRGKDVIVVWTPNVSDSMMTLVAPGLRADYSFIRCENEDADGIEVSLCRTYSLSPLLSTEKKTASTLTILIWTLLALFLGVSFLFIELILSPFLNTGRCKANP